MTRFTLRIATLVLATSAVAWSQNSHPTCKVDAYQGPSFSYRFKNITQQTDMNDALTALRNLMDPQSAKLFLIPSQSMITMRGCPEEIDLAKNLLQEIDQPRKAYKLVYTLTEVDGTKRSPSQSFTLNTVDGQRSVLKQGDRVPISTGLSGDKGAQTSIQYVDVGINIDAMPAHSGDGIILRSKVERSAVAGEKMVSGLSDPAINQSLIESTIRVEAGKQVKIGTIDIAGTSRHLEVEVAIAN